MKTTNTNEPKAPKTVLVRELIPWMIVAMFTFTTTGLITGWFFHANVAASTQTVQAPVSKEQRR